MSRRLMILGIVTAVLVGPTAYAQAAPYSGVVSVDKVEAEPGDHFSVAVRMTNNDAKLGGLIVPLRLDHADLSLDSVSVGFLIPQDWLAIHFVFPGEKILQMSYIPAFDDSLRIATTLVDSEGVVATLWLSLSSEALPGLIRIDSVNEFNELPPRYVQASDADGNFIAPQFIAGEILVRVPTAVEDDPSNLPARFELAQNYPNPFNPTTVISFSLPQSGHVDLTVYNVLGQAIDRLIDGYREAGRHEVAFDASSQPSGVYFYRISYDGLAETKKMMLVK